MVTKLVRSKSMQKKIQLNGNQYSLVKNVVSKSIALSEAKKLRLSRRASIRITKLSPSLKLGSSSPITLDYKYSLWEGPKLMDK